MQLSKKEQWNQAHSKTITVKFYEKDYDLYEWAKKHTQPGLYIRELIRADLKRSEN